MAAKLHRNIAYIVSQLRLYCMVISPILSVNCAYISWHKRLFSNRLRELLAKCIRFFIIFCIFARKYQP